MPSWAGNTDRLTIRPKDKFLAFDLETLKITVEGIELLAQRPLGISCVVTVATGNRGLVWYGGACQQITQLQCKRLVEYLEMKDKEGYTIVTYNGAGFDFLILAEESGEWEACRELALSHIDMAFAMFAEKGFMVSLQSICEGLELPSKAGSGADVPRLWAEGKRQEVLDYVRQDGRVTMNVFQEIQKCGHVRWVTRAGTVHQWFPSSGRLLTVREAMRLPLPDTDWMDKPWPREKFTSWLKENNK